MRTLTQGPYSVRYKAVDYIGVSVKVVCPQGGSWWYTIVPPGGYSRFQVIGMIEGCFWV